MFISADNVTALGQWLVNGLTDMAMTDYPASNSFLEPVPAWPVNASCAVYDKCLNSGVDQCKNLSVHANELSVDFFDSLAIQLRFMFSQSTCFQIKWLSPIQAWMWSAVPHKPSACTITALANRPATTSPRMPPRIWASRAGTTNHVRAATMHHACADLSRLRATTNIGVDNLTLYWVFRQAPRW
jgi:hypothetical protein